MQHHLAFVRMKYFFVLHQLFFLYMKHFFVQHQHTFLSTPKYFLCNVKLFVSTQNYFSPNFYFGHRLECYVMVIYFYCHNKNISRVKKFHIYVTQKNYFVFFFFFASQFFYIHLLPYTLSAC